MALFGKKKADGAPADNTAKGATAPAAPVAAKARKIKEPKAPKSTKAKGGTIVGLNIGNAFIKAVEVTSKGGQLSVTGMGVIATPPESYNNGNVLSVTALSNAIRSMWKQAGLSSKSTVFSVAGTGSLVVRVIEVPKMSDGELADNMKVDADRYIPFPPSEVVMEAKALRDLPNDPDAANMEVLLAAAQREIIDLHVSVVQKAKLTPRAIDVEPLALARVLQLDLLAQNPIVDYDDVTAVLNIGQTGTEITIMRGDIVVFTRSVPNGGGNLTSAIAESMGIPTSDAERLKIERGDALPPAGYAQGGDDDDFGFGDFDDGTGGGATVDFSGGGGFDDDFGADASPSATATADPSATAAPTSDDPFDLDFFDQGPQQSEPGAGHAQKEDDEDEAPITFSFDDDLSPTRGSDAAKVTPASPPPPIQAQDTPVADAPVADAPPSMEDFDLPDAYLPAMNDAPSDAPSAEAAPAMPAMPSAFDFSDFDLPATETAPTPAPASEPAPIASAPAPTQKLPEEPAPVAQDSTATAPAFGGFGFSDGDTTAAPVADAPVADVSVADVPVADAPASPISFAKDDAATDEVVIAPTADATEPAISLDKSDADAVSLAEPADDEAIEDDFGLDDVFGAPAEADAVPLAATADEGGFDVGVFSDDPSGDFDVSGIDVSAEESDDFTSFGTGLSQTGETDDASLYAAMQPVLDDLATEVRRSLEFHLGRYPDTTFSRLVLVGGGAKLRNLDEFLAGNLGVPTSVGDPFAHIKINAPGLPPEFAPTNAPLCAVALGLALRDFIE